MGLGGRIGTIVTRSEVERKAAEILRTHGLFAIPVDPVLLANRLGIKCLNARFSQPGLSGLIAKRGDSVTIFVDDADPPFRKRFTIAHELGHRLLHLVDRDGEFVDSERDLFRTEKAGETEQTARRAEIEANWFAAALLMPADLVRQQFEITPDVEQLARAFNVSHQAMGYRLETLGLG